MKRRLTNIFPSAYLGFRCGALVLLLGASSAAGRTLIDASAFRLYEGSRITGITLKGNNSTRDFVIEREIGLAVGDTLDVEKLVEGVQNLENLGVFGSIIVLPDGRSDGVELEFQFREMPSFIPYVALRYTEENDFSIGPALSSVNLFGRAIKVSGRLLFGGTSEFDLVVDYPWITGDYHLGADLAASHLVRDDEVRGFEETSDEITPWIKRHIGKSGRVRATAGYFGMKADRDGVTLSSDRSDRFFRVGAAIGHDTRDSWRDPRSGWENEIELLGTIGDGDFGTATLDIRRFQRVSAKHTLFIGVLTSLQSGTAGEDVPSYFQYSLGGASTIRGQPVDLGKTLYGKNQLISTLEYQVSVLPLRPYNFFRWSAALGVQCALFMDTGIAWSESDEFSSRRAKTGFGVGLRLLVPAAEMVRFDVGLNAQGDVYLHFGGHFKWTAQRSRIR